MNTLKLFTSWDLMLDSSGNIFMISDGNAIAQDVASAISTFQGELYYDTTQGMPYFGQILGQAYNRVLLQSLLEKTAMTVPGVVQAQATITGFTNRQITGTVKVIDSTGAATGVTF